MTLGSKIGSFLLAILCLFAGYYLFTERGELPSVNITPRKDLESGLAIYLVESKACASTQDCREKIDQYNGSFLEKRTYCCVHREESYRCRGLKEFKNEIGRLTAQFKCAPHELVARDCKDETRCTNGGSTPWVAPACNEGDSDFVRKVHCRTGYWEETRLCHEGQWVRQDVDSGCSQSPSGTSL